MVYCLIVYVEKGEGIIRGFYGAFLGMLVYGCLICWFICSSICFNMFIRNF